jgi:UDP-2,3-diacylglucosamine hydrolase
MVKAYFLSDTHLGLDESNQEYEKQKIVLKFLENIKKDATHLYIVGDLFDFWFEYRQVIPKKFFPFLYILKQLSDNGIEIHYFAGNHDFYLGTFFEKEMNIKTWPDDYEFELAGKRFYLWHGDGLGKKDGSYRFLKKLMRNRVSQNVFKLLHPDFGIPFAHWISGSSRQYTNQLNHLRDESDYIKFAEKKFASGTDFVLMGHRHNPLVHEVNGKKYINLGDWINHSTFAVFDGQNLELKHYIKKDKS